MEDNTLSKIIGFIHSIGLECQPGAVRSDSFLPGVEIDRGVLIYDADRLLSAGDLLHEAGHIAVVLPEHRLKMQNGEHISGDMEEGGAEMAAIAWSWAALTHLELVPEVVFHAQGYKGGGQSLIEAFQRGHGVGVPVLHWLGMTDSPHIAAAGTPSLFPAMKRWLR